MKTAELFWTGKNQAVRLPEEYRFPRGVREVEIRREGRELVFTPPAPKAWPASFWRAFGSLSEDFARPERAPRERGPGPVTSLPGSDEYEGLLETIEILRDDAVVEGLAEAEQELASGGGHPLDDVRAEILREGLSPADPGRDDPIGSS